MAGERENYTPRDRVNPAEAPADIAERGTAHNVGDSDHELED